VTNAGTAAIAAVTRLTTVAAVALLTLGCGCGIRTAVDYDGTVNLSTYATFFMTTGQSSGNPLIDRRVAGDISAALRSKGWKEVPAGEGRAAVVVNAATTTVVVDIVDAATKQAIWHGSAAGALSHHPRLSVQVTQEAITKLFAEFPQGARPVTSHRQSK
jgi:hypothetical protein